MHSMTAFARREKAADGFEVAWELRSLNQRSLEVRFRLPEELCALEHPLREKVGQSIRRGRLLCVLSVEQIGAPHSLELNRPLLLQLLAALEQVRRDAPEAHAANPIDLLRWPGMLRSAADEPLAAAATELFGEALAALGEARAAEGERLKQGILERLAEIESILSESKALAAGLASTVRTRLQRRLADLDLDLDAGRLEQEVALLAQRADVAEELDRLGIHLQDARSHLEGPGPHGRRLDFIIQEMQREANTLAAKSLLPQASRITVDLKVAIEQIREQAQNIE